MKTSSTHKLTRCICFWFLFCLGFTVLNDKLIRETVSGPWNYTVKIRGFYQEQPQSIEILGLGSSHMYCTMIPYEIWQSSQINSYVFSTQEQSFKITYHYLLEALQTQMPKVVLLETHMFNYDSSQFNDGAASNAIENLNWSTNKVDLIRNTVPLSQQIEFFLPVLKYHSLWTTMTLDTLQNQYHGQQDPFRGYVYLNETHKVPDLANPSDSPVYEIRSEDQVYLDKIVELTKGNNIELVLFHAPAQMDEKTYASQQYLKTYAQTNNIHYLDLNEHIMDMFIQPEKDFYDTGHLNVLGARKVTNYLTNYLQTQVTFDKVYSEATLEDIEEANQQYEIEIVE